MPNLSAKCSVVKWTWNWFPKEPWHNAVKPPEVESRPFFTPAGYGTEVAEGKETREFHGKMYVMEKAFEADFSFVKAWKGDEAGNLIFKGTARNFNPAMCGAGKITIAEVEELVPAGELDPNQIHIPGIFIQRIFQGEKYEKRIEQLTVRKRN